MTTIIQRLLTKTVLLIVLLAAASTVSNAATLTSNVDRNKISINETFTLTISYDAQIDGSSIDLSVLESDFDVLRANPQSASTVSVTNGKTTRLANTTWTVLLAAKKTGTLTIPSFSINNDQSKAIKIAVNDSRQAKTSDQPLQVLVSADQASVYLSQQLIVEVEISAQADVADLNGPQLVVNNADVEPLEQQNFQRVDNGVARRIVTLRYAVFPKQVGELVIPIMTYSGVQGGSRSVFSSSGSQVIARSSQLTVQVKEAPVVNAQPFASASWFPAQAVTIESNWSADKNTMSSGEPITRTITIRARGQRANTIPPLARPKQPSGYKSYRDQAQLDTKVDSEGFISTRIESEAIVVSKAGELVLPALDVSWWNVGKEQWEVATLPAETLQVAASVSSGDNSYQNSDSIIIVDTTDSATTSTTATNGQLTIWQWLTGLLLLVCGTQSWFLLTNTRRPGAPQHTALEIHSAQSEQDAWRELKKSLPGGETRQLRRKLVTWAGAAITSERAVSLQTLVHYCDNTDLGSEIENLESHLYQTEADNDNGFNPERLLSLLAPFRQKLLKGSPSSMASKALPPLYPQ